MEQKQTKRYLYTWSSFALTYSLSKIAKVGLFINIKVRARSTDLTITIRGDVYLPSPLLHKI